MLFNSIDFAIFFPIVFILYWFVTNKSLQLQNILLLVASYIFYGWWDWRFLSLIFLSTVVDYMLGKQIAKTEDKRKRKTYLILSLVINLGFLGFFKYYNFFVDNFVSAFSLFDTQLSISTLKIILPVGISFYTFQTLSYTLDIYKGKLQPSNNFISFAAFVSFFPQLVAGPIERASHLLPQFYKKRSFDYNFAVSGMQLIVWGFFKKMVIADNAAILVDGIFSQYAEQSSLALILGMVLFAFQIYCDFSGYSDIAIGTGRLFGFDLMTNFKFPYLSRDISEFWKRWHISLSTWFRDYVYIPLGGSRVSQKMALRNIFVVFLVSGFWHGANWTFIIWGLIHALLYIPVFLKPKKELTANSTLKNISSTVITFVIVCFAWVFFRANSVGDAVEYISRLVSWQEGSNFAFSNNKYMIVTLISLGSIVGLMFVEYLFYRKDLHEVKLPAKILLFVCLLICFLGAFKNPATFIYFQF